MHQNWHEASTRYRSLLKHLKTLIITSACPEYETQSVFSSKQNSIPHFKRILYRIAECSSDQLTTSSTLVQSDLTFFKSDSDPLSDFTELPSCECWEVEEADCAVSHSPASSHTTAYPMIIGYYKAIIIGRLCPQYEDYKVFSSTEWYIEGTVVVLTLFPSVLTTGASLLLTENLHEWATVLACEWVCVYWNDFFPSITGKRFSLLYQIPSNPNAIFLGIQ